MTKIFEFFQDTTGCFSMTRLLSFMLVIAGILHAFIYKDHVMSSILIGAGLTGKVAQRAME